MPRDKPLHDYECVRIYDRVENQEICCAENIKDLLARFLERIHEHNISDDSKIDGSKDELELSDLADGFRKNSFEIQIGALIKKMEFATDE